MKKILVVYQDWENWIENDKARFEYWFKKLDGVYDSTNMYYIVGFSSKSLEFNYSKNIKVFMIKSTPKKQFFDLFKLRKKIKKLDCEISFDFVYSPFIYLLSALPKIKAKVIGFLRENTAKFSKSAGGYKRIFGNIFYLLDYLAFKKIDLVLYNNEQFVNYLRKNGFNGDSKFNPRDVQDKDLYEKYFKESKTNLELVKEYDLKHKKVILTVARVSPEKNFELAIKALYELPKNFVYLVIGDFDFDYKNKLNDLILKLGLVERMFFLGRVDHKNIWEYYNISNYFWLVSKTEGVPNVIQEAFYAKVPCIVSNIKEMKSIVKCDVELKNSLKLNGIILKENLPKYLAKETLSLNRNKELRDAIVRNASSDILKRIKNHKPVSYYFK